MKQKHVIINCAKGIYTLEELLELLRKNAINFKLVVKERSNTTTKSKRSPSPNKSQKGG